MKQKTILLIFLFALCNLIAVSQESVMSERKQIRYLKKIEKKNDRYVRKEEKRTHKLIARLSEKEKALYEKLDSTQKDSSLLKNNFSKIEERLLTDENADPEKLIQKLGQPITAEKTFSLNLIPENADGAIKDYLKQQITTTTFLSDSACSTCAKLKKQTAKTKENISKTTAKIERLKAAQGEVKKHQATLKKFGVSTPELADNIKGMEKTSYYFNQGSSGFNSIFSNPGKGIESSVLKKLSFNRNFSAFQANFTALKIPALTTGAVPDMSGYQTKAQVQAMLPQNAAGINVDEKAQLLSNMQSSLMQFTELRDAKPDVSMLKEKPTFKVNPYKGLPLRQRLIPAFTFQPQVKALKEPMLVNVGATLGFKLTGLLTPMIGVSARLGFGKDIQHIAFSYEGIVAKAGMDVKLLYGFSFQGWYEATWKPYPTLLAKDQKINYPEPSLIAGICNTYKISNKVSGTFMFGYDFFYKKHTPYSSPWIVRLGWQ